jgi:hypothetical protein
MLYPLSYEGVRPISYLPGRSQSCPGVPGAAKRCRRAVLSLLGAHADQHFEEDSA